MIVIKDLQCKVIDCKRTNNRIIKLQMIYGGQVVNIILAYALQTGCTIESKENFYHQFEQAVLKCR